MIQSPSSFSKERIRIIDSLRGFAIFGILFINLPYMALSDVVSDPSLLNETGINRQLWLTSYWIFYGTQRAMFSLLFGASVLLFINNKQNSEEGISVADLFLRRQMWLIVFGLINVYILLWDGDIIFDYGCYGLILYVFRNLPPKKLFIASAICALFMIARENRDFFIDKSIINRGELIAKIDTTVTKLTIKQKEQLAAMEELKSSSTRESCVKDVEKANRMMTGSFEDVFKYRTDTYISGFVHYTVFAIWDVLLFMFAGMAFLKLDILTCKASVKLYAAMAVIGLSIGLGINWYRLDILQKADFNYYDFIKQMPFNVYETGRIFRSLGLFGLLMLLYKSNLFHWLFNMMKPVGQMAFTNYLSQSLIGAIIFYGFGFAWYGKLQRYEVFLAGIVLMIFQIIFSHIWLRYYTMGPLEWIWRQLTYWKRLSIRKNKV
ncbi:DUF418 domain-containing protein [Lacibacter sp. MH-610]|uniref:DUF418 domain-containing protein n=1 Tax=Lacibacter sp. MH-610 TaxID=3020883 RepID=UPI003891C242